MKKLLISLDLVIALYFSARPFVLVTVDDGIAGVSVRASVSQRFAPLQVWRW